MTGDRVFECPRCHDRREEPLARAVAHACPENGGKAVSYKELNPAAVAK